MAHWVGVETPLIGNRPLRESGTGRGGDVPLALVDEVLVGLVGDEREAVLTDEGGDFLDLEAREDLPGGVGRGVPVDELGLLREPPSESGGEAVAARLLRGDQDRLGPVVPDHVDDRGPVGREHQDFVFAVEQRRKGCEKTVHPPVDDDRALVVRRDRIAVPDLREDRAA